MSQFAFLKPEWPEVYEAATRAEDLAYPDPRTSCFYARRVLELSVEWMYRNDSSLDVPYQENLSALLHEPTFRDTVGPAIFGKVRILKDLGNQAVHTRKPVRQYDAIAGVRELFHFCFWLARTYARGVRPSDALTFDPSNLPKTSPLPKQTVAQLQALETQLEERDKKLLELVTEKSSLDQELKSLREEIVRIKAANVARPDTHDYSEAQTRDYFIDLILREAGWWLDQKQDREYEVSGMPNQQGKGYVDYVLWGDDGKPLGVVEAKRTKRDSRAGQQQAKLYADCLEAKFGQRPVIFYTNGYEHWIWDDRNYPPRSIQGFYKNEELQLLIQRRETKQALATAEINSQIVERYYQTRAIRKISEAFEHDHLRKVLLVMATGAGKTRTVVALCDLLMRCNWIKRVLFLADRVALVRQAVNVFKTHLPASSPVNLVTEKDAEGRVYVSTYPTMMSTIDDIRDGQRKFGPGHFDLVVIDEAHRSVYQKYGAIFEYFDSLLVGLTATPKDEVDRNTYRLFELETGLPTDAYSLDDAVNDHFLVPPHSVAVPLKFQREGITYDELSEEDKERWDALEWDESGEIPDRVEAQAVNKWLFNEDTVDKVLEHLMTRGMKVAGGDRLGKTIIFAKNHAHAQFIEKRFNANYPNYRGEFARIIDHQVEYAQSLIDDFSNVNKAPHIAISVDMLDTGIDIPEIVNLVFFKLVRSKTKFWQMVGRGTRLRPDLFGPGQDKEFFYIFDYCQNLEFFSQQIPTTEGYLAEPLNKKLFGARLELIGALDHKFGAKVSDGGSLRLAETQGEIGTDRQVREDAAETLRSRVAAMNVDNFIVRPHRRLIERYAKPEAWTALKPSDASELFEEVADLPSELPEDEEEAKRFDLLMLRLQLGLLLSNPGFERMRDQVREIAGLLEEKETIPMVREQMSLIQEIQTDEFWQDVTVPILENARRRLRLLVKFIEKAKRRPVYTDFQDEMGSESAVELPGFTSGVDYERFRAKAEQFLNAHENEPAIRKLRLNIPLSSADINELERLFLEAGIGTSKEINRAKLESQGFGLFVRSVVGLDRETVKRAFGKFLTGKIVGAKQIEFINMIIDHLTEHGIMDPVLLYQSPFTDINPTGPEGIFTSDEVDGLIAILGEIRKSATV